RYRASLEKLEVRLSSIRETAIEGQRSRAISTLVLGLFSLVSVGAVWALAIHRYQQNVESRKSVERQLREERERQLHSSKMAALGEMAGGIAHEINNPLGIILGYTERIQD